MALRSVAPFSTRKAGSCPSSWLPSPSAPLGLYVRHPPSYVPLVTRMVAVIDVLPVDVQVAPVMPPPPLLDDELLVLELEVELELVELELLVLELDEPVFEYEQYRGLSTPIDGNSEP